MTKRTFYILDVFAEQKYAGNQLAVFRHVEGISDMEMQKIAQEMHFSETTFILSEEEKNGGYDVRIFTPASEVPFAGHPTLGTAYAIQQEIIRKPVEEVILNLKVGQIPVTMEYKGSQIENMWMKQNEPTFGETFNLKSISQSLGVDPKEIDDNFPIQEVSTGLPFIIVPLKTQEAIKRTKVDQDNFFALVENSQAKAVMVFCPQTKDPKNDLKARVFVDYYGIPEDPATGSANGCLAGYLVKYRYFGKDKIDVKVEQGYEIGRPSLLLLKAEKTEKGISVRVGGQAVMVARGEFI
ncbi:MAG TPA: PhzF family phenazine biosynthesis protein [candidate division Zixibacteria bacterium]